MGTQLAVVHPMAHRLRVAVLCLAVLACPWPLAAQGSSAAPDAAANDPAVKDRLGRSTPRGTVLGFLAAARRGETALARQYLDTRLDPARADQLAIQLFAVLDARLPARLTQISDLPEGSHWNPLDPDEDLVGTIEGPDTTVDIVVRRVTRGGAPIWLFSPGTLEQVPRLYAALVASRTDAPLARVLSSTPLGSNRAVDWALILGGLVLFYIATVVLNRALTPLVRWTSNRLLKRNDAWLTGALPVPARLLLVALGGQWAIASLSLSLLVRQFWANAASLVIVASIAWILILLNGHLEAYVCRRMPQATAPAAASLVRLLRRGADVIVLFGALLATLRLFAVDPTPALAGLGVGGIAVALAAQKTLENVIAGASLIFDQAVRDGDVLRMGDITGTVEHIGLRSTRIRTLDRTVVSIPNSQLANASVETLSARDKFWFHPVVGLGYETTPEQLQSILDAIRSMLAADRRIERHSIRVRFIRLGAFSLDLEVFAYIMADDYAAFLEAQEALLVSITEIIARAGAEIAYPTQRMYVSGPARQL